MSARGCLALMVSLVGMLALALLLLGAPAMYLIAGLTLAVSLTLVGVALRGTA